MAKAVRPTVAMVALFCAAPVFAQTAQPVVPADATEKGVRVLRPDEPKVPDVVTPTPSPPAPVPVPVQMVTPTPAPITLCARPFATTDVQWDGVTKIDKVLARRLKTRQRVVIDLAQPYPERGAAPAGLTRWLSEVGKGGGAVTVKQYCKAARGGLGSWLAQLFGGGGGRVYRPARQYDVVLHADALDRVVTQVEFLPKGSSL